MGRLRSPAVIAVTVAIVIWVGVGAMYFLNPFHTASRDLRARIFGYLPYRAPSRSMEPTIPYNSIFWVKTWPLASRDPRVGEIIVFFFPPNPEIAYVKRVVATGGSTFEMHGGIVSVDGHALDELYVAKGPWLPQARADFGPLVVPEGSFFVLGDNRGNSEDSRSWGTVPRKLVIGVYTPGESKE